MNWLSLLGLEGLAARWRANLIEGAIAAGISPCSSTQPFRAPRALIAAKAARTRRRSPTP